ncbi:MAG TPA: biopolymer transporter ExbD [Algoriphagus sp.]|jgi:biopolymer transport protein ExbD|uniref:Outer membrane transport energization protein ExbD n=1 Tax=Algoriphagus ornithinivorans TaxID=226506 RepID=A0A1I5GZ78_9BACT|nr:MULTISPECIES: biopolymer transporter ExbD [Algoriphagus]MAL13536.1 biopolymer transporter ExbD [Algoriphagus sp.]MAN86278.1 biopolymer transporter ExbD [Algoriphagus sp.]QYH38354.1 biopolymer transporter ExbD [Algoriphagus sp. NBT04N3]SFO41086.1 outer membrane transport energization protein ExbD [Algoriphagus ornithinivorans]HAS60989.1 biopolymer transporter ExbD [Algoriphagus sp.]|tara:strand:- start:3247 stop:3636 length:390 start_codon:yes stop_codon:yes gene_type:complete
MGLQSKNKVETAFSMSSMTDIIFLLLIFFMLTSSFITPSGLPVNLPSSETSDIALQEVTVSVTKDLRYAVNDRVVARDQIKAELTNLLANKKGQVVLHIDKEVPVEYLVEIGGIAAGLEANVSIATKPY